LCLECPWTDVSESELAIKKLEKMVSELQSENIILMNAIQRLDAGVLPDGSVVEGAVTLFAESVLASIEQAKEKA
jgi:hypothetical protein